jgi:hypothetical protein
LMLIISKIFMVLKKKKKTYLHKRIIYFTLFSTNKTNIKKIIYIKKSNKATFQCSF